VPLRLVRPAAEHLPQYLDALRRGWSPDNLTPERTAREQMEAIGRDPAGFLAGLDDPEGKAGPITLPDGIQAPRLPGFRRWMWDDVGFCGSIGFRWQPGTPALPPYVKGHVGYAVVPWRRGRGHATRALGLLLAEIAGLPGLPWVELTTEAANVPSVRVIAANGGRMVERFSRDGVHGGADVLRYRIDLPRPAPAGDGLGQ
jgi:predicted acetyltransferase